MISVQELENKIKQEGNFKMFFYRDYKCMIRRIGDDGHLCGYVALPKNHVLYGKSFTEIKDKYDLIVHRGLTFSDFFGDQQDDRWYIGFDCAHTGDLIPSMYTKFDELCKTIYRDMEYVEEECKKLVDQIIDIRNELF
jgi:hypothetical protein